MASLLFLDTSQRNALTFTEGLYGWGFQRDAVQNEKGHTGNGLGIFFFSPHAAATQLNNLLELELWMSRKVNSVSFKSHISTLTVPLVLEDAVWVFREGSFQPNPLPILSHLGLSHSGWVWVWGTHRSLSLETERKSSRSLADLSSIDKE